MVIESSAHLQHYGGFQGDPSSSQLSRYFYLSDADLRAVRERHGEVNRFGFALQLCTVRYLGTFNTDLSRIPSTILSFVSSQLGVSSDPRMILSHYRSERTIREHQVVIINLYEYREYSDPAVRFRLTRMLYTKVWLSTERITTLFWEATAWLVSRRILLPSAPVLERLILEVRSRARTRVSRAISRKLDSSTKERLLGLLKRQDGSHTTTLERLRKTPAKLTIEEFLRSLDRVKSLSALLDIGPLFQKLDLSDIPPARLRGMYRYVNTSSAQTIDRIGYSDPERRVAMLAAWVQLAYIKASDDALLLFDQLVSRLLSKAARKGKKERLRSIKELDKAARLLSDACRVLLDSTVDDPAVREAAFTRVSKADLVKAIDSVGEITRPPDDEYLEHLKGSYTQVRRFLPKFLSTFDFEGIDSSKPILDALHYLRSLEGTKKQRLQEAPREVITKPWMPFVIQGDTVSRRYYTLCSIERLRMALRRRDIYLPKSERWGDPRANLLTDDEWTSHKQQILRTVGRNPDGRQEISELADKLHAAYSETSAGLANNKTVSIVKGGLGGKDRLSLGRLNEDPDPETLSELRSRLHPMLPKIDLPQLLLEIDAKTDFSSHFVSLGEEREKAKGFNVSICAVLLAEACNIGLEPLVRHDVPALTRARLEWVQHNYLREETLTRASAELVNAQNRLSLTYHWGEGKVASADGLRFSVPVQTINAGPNSKYFGTGRGITYYNYTSDQCTGFHGIVVPGTLRDSLFILDGLLEQQTLLKPQELMTDTAGYSDVVFGLFHLLGFRFSPRIADVGDARLWRFDSTADYGELGPLSKNIINPKLIIDNYDDMLRIAGSLRLGRVRASEFMRTLQKGKGVPPSTIARAIAELGKIEKTLYLLSIMNDEDYRRRILRQLNRGEARHSLARAVCHGQRGEIRKRYREGQEDQLSALGLVVNAIVLWNTLYMEAALTRLEQTHVIRDDDKARLLPLIHEHINLLGRYSFSVEEQLGEGCLRPLNLEEHVDLAS